MAGVLSAAPVVLAWVLASIAWSALAFCGATMSDRAHKREGWASYWLAWLIVAIAPPISAPLFAAAPIAPTQMQIDAALSLANWTAPAQRDLALFGAGLALAGAAILAALTLGMIWRGLRLLQGFARARAIVSNARDSEITHAIGVKVLTTDESAPVFCVGGRCAAIILPAPALRQMSPEQARLVLRHELAHIERRDPILFLALECIEAVFWFNPFVRRLTTRTRLAAEIACDAIALEANQAQRKTYAAALVQALDQDSSDLSPAIAAFGDRAAMPRIRLAHILGGFAHKRARVFSHALLVVALTLSLGGAAAAATTGRLAVLGDPTLLAALSTRIAVLYGAPQCTPGEALQGVVLTRNEP